MARGIAKVDVQTCGIRREIVKGRYMVQISGANDVKDGCTGRWL